MSANNANQNKQKSGESEDSSLWLDDEEMEIPPRRTLHQPEFMRVSRYFQIGLLTIFWFLTAGIFIWYHWFMD